MKSKELQSENDGLRAQIAGLTFKLQENEQKHDMFLQTLHAYKDRVDALEEELKLLRMSNYAAKQYSDDERNY